MLLAITINMVMLPAFGYQTTEPIKRSWPLLLVIKQCPTIALVELQEVKVLDKDAPGEPFFGAYSLRASLVENWRGSFPRQSTIEAHLNRSTHEKMKRGDRAVLFVNKIVDPATDASITPADLKYLGGGFCSFP